MIINSDNIHLINIGSSFFSSGGGSSYVYPKLLCLPQLQRKSAHTISLESLNDDDIVIPVGTLGTPEHESEKMLNIKSLEILIERIQASYPSGIKYFALFGIAGNHHTLPIFLSSYFDIPLLDADCAGRCFPGMTMISLNYHQIPIRRAFFTNTTHHIFEFVCDNLTQLSHYAAHIVESSGGFCTAVPQVLTGQEAKAGLIPGTLSQALTIGQVIEDTGSLEELSKHVPGRPIGTGGVVEVELWHKVKPFTRRIIVKNLAQKKTWHILMGNEYDVILENGRVIGQIPDIICFCSPTTSQPYAFNQLHYGMNVSIFLMKAPDIWYTPKGLELVNQPDYCPQEERQLCA